MKDWTLKIYSNFEQIESEDFLLKWENLMAKSPTMNVFFTPTLVKVWMETYLPLRDIKPLFVWGEKDGNVAFFPLVSWRKNWKNAFMKVIVPVGYSDYDYADPVFLVENPEDIEHFWDELYKTLDNYEYDEITIDGLHHQFIPQNGRIVRTEKCPYIDLREYGDMEAYLGKLPRKLRCDINRRFRKVESEGGHKFIIYNKESLSQALCVLPSMMMWHAKRWPNSYCAPHFHEILIREGVKNNIVRLSQLNINGESVSWKVEFIFKKRIYSYMPTLTDYYPKCSPGKLHLYLCLKDAIAEKVNVYDNLRGDEEYKSDWTKGCAEEIYTIKKENGNFCARLRKNCCIVKDMVKQVLRHR